MRRPRLQLLPSLHETMVMNNISGGRNHQIIVMFHRFRKTNTNSERKMPLHFDPSSLHSNSSVRCSLEPKHIGLGLTSSFIRSILSYELSPVRIFVKKITSSIIIYITADSKNAGRTSNVVRRSPVAMIAAAMHHPLICILISVFVSLIANQII